MKLCLNFSTRHRCCGTFALTPIAECLHDVGLPFSVGRLRGVGELVLHLPAGDKGCCRSRQVTEHCDDSGRRYGLW